VACITSFALHGNMSMMMAMTALAVTYAGHALPAISFAVAMHVIGMFGLSLPLGHLADRLGWHHVMLGGTVAAGAGSVCVSLSSAYWVVTAGTFLVGLGWSAMNIAVAALFADTTPPQERGRVLGVNDALTATASIGLSLLAGPLVALVGLESLTVASVGLLLVPLILLLGLHESSPGTYGMPAAHELGQEDKTLGHKSPVTPSRMEVTHLWSLVRRYSRVCSTGWTPPCLQKSNTQSSIPQRCTRSPRSASGGWDIGSMPNSTLRCVRTCRWHKGMPLRQKCGINCYTICRISPTQ
jgi:MFS family permease